jgi:molybdopterin converting factor small subunit
MKVSIPSALRSYTGRAMVETRGATLDAVLRDLDARYPGLRFRIIDEQERLRPHMRLFVRSQDTRDLTTALSDGDEVHIVGALSGG